MTSSAQVQHQPARETIYRLADARVTVGDKSDPRVILDDIDLDIARGEFVVVVGRSGTGKTTLLRALSGLSPLSSGVRELEGKSFTSPPRGVVTVFQDYGSALLPWRTAAKNVSLPLEGRLKRRELAARVAEVLNVVGLGGREHDYLASLSGGMQQRVQIARALLVNPEVLLMDEPFGALDAMTKAALQDVLQDLHRRLGTTVVFITHDLDEAIYLADRVFVIAGQPGRISLELGIDLPRPRHQVTTREQPEYLQYRHVLSEALGLGEAGS